MAEIDVAVTFDEHKELKFVNRAGTRLLNQPAERLLGRDADEIGLSDCLSGEVPRVINTAPGGPAAGRSAAASSARVAAARTAGPVGSGQPPPGRGASAWQRLIRVIGHEMNNSLARSSRSREPVDDHRERAAAGRLAEDMQRGLNVIGPLGSPQPVHEARTHAWRSCRHPSWRRSISEPSSIASRPSRKRTTSRSPPVRR